MALLLESSEQKMKGRGWQKVGRGRERTYSTRKHEASRQGRKSLPTTDRGPWTNIVTLYKG